MEISVAGPQPMQHNTAGPIVENLYDYKWNEYMNKINEWSCVLLVLIPALWQSQVKLVSLLNSAGVKSRANGSQINSYWFTRINPYTFVLKH